MGKATEGELGEVHGKVARIMSTTLDRMQAAAEAELTMTVTDEDGNETEVPIPVDEPSPAFLNACLTFLKHNDITAVAEESGSLSTVQQSLAKRAQNRPPALAEIEHLDDHRSTG